jgi:hypothetical protein
MIGIGRSGGMALFCMAFCTVTTAVYATSSFDTTRADWSAAIPAGTTIHIENELGDVRLRFGGYDHKPILHAVIQRADGSPVITTNPVLDKTKKTLTVTLKANQSLGKSRVDLGFYIPEGHNVVVQTTAGLIEVKGIRDLVVASTTSGAIFAKGNRGPMQLNTQSGAIEMSLHAPKEGVKTTVSSTTGEITVALPIASNLLLTAATSGLFATEISLDVEPQPGNEPNKIATSVLGERAMAGELAIQSKRGDIKLLRPLPFTPAAAQADPHPLNQSNLEGNDMPHAQSP